MMTEEQEKMWKRLSEPYPRPIVFQTRYGYDNIAIGHDAVSAITSGTQNVAIGYKALATSPGPFANAFKGIIE